MHMNQLIPLPLQQILHRNPCSLRHHPQNIVRRHPIWSIPNGDWPLFAWSPSAGSWRCSSGIVEKCMHEASSNCATSNWCLASSSLRLAPLILSSRGLSTQNPSQFEFVVISVHSPVCQTLVKTAQLLLDLVPPLHAEGVIFVFQALQLDLERHYLPL